MRDFFVNSDIVWATQAPAGYLYDICSPSFNGRRDPTETRHEAVYK